MGLPHLVIASNRGPLSFTRDENGRVVTERGAGGLVSALGPAVAGTGATWVAAAISEADREAAAGGLVEAEGFRFQSLLVDQAEYGAFYDTIANATLWYLHHGLWDLARRPRFDRDWRRAWAAYRAVNRAFAEAIAEAAPDGATVLVQDYHLALVGAQLREIRADLSTAHFHHTPFCDPQGLRLLPDDVAAELLGGLAGFGACGFHAERWRASFEACAREVLGQSPPTFVSPAGPDLEDLDEVARSAACVDAGRALDAEVGDRRLIVRVDRIELSKNILRGFLAFDDLLSERPEWRGQVVFGAFVYPSRQGVPEYRQYREEVEALAASINQRWGGDGWTPILLDTSDDFPRSVAALRRSDVLLVNPIRDGLNLVAMEGPAINERDGVLVLSREAGAWEEIGEHAVVVHPYDVVATAEALHQALVMPAAERARRAAALRAVARSRRSHDWLEDQVRAAASAPR